MALVVKNPPANAGDTRDMGPISGSGRFPGVGNGNPLQYSCLGHPMDWGAWGATVHRVAENQTQLKQSKQACAILRFWRQNHFPALWDPIDCSLPGSSARGILQARILEWVAISSSRGSSWPRDQTHVPCVSCIGRQVLYHWGTWEALAIVDPANMYNYQRNDFRK